MSHTLTLDPATWDLTLTGSGRIATSAGAYAVAQNAANACRLFTGDAYFNRRAGIPHFDVALGQRYRQLDTVIRERLKRAAEAVEGVEKASVSLIYSGDKNRLLGGDIVLTLDNGETVKVEI